MYAHRERSLSKIAQNSHLLDASYKEVLLLNEQQIE